MNREEWDILREGWAFEAKLAQGRGGQGQIPGSFWETYSAFANTDGGVFVLGAAERPDGSLEARGIADLDKVERELWNNLQNPQKVSANLLTKSNVTREELDGHQVLVICVPKAPRTLRPVHLNGSLERAYQRVHEGDRLMRPEIVRRMVGDSIFDRDSIVIEHFTEADLDPESVRRYRNVFASRRPEHPYVTEDDTGFLRQIGALKQERGQSALGVTMGGLLVLGRELSIRDRFPHWHLSYRELPAEVGTELRWVDRVWSDGSWNANLFEFYTRVVLKLYEGLKVPFALEGGQFRIDETPAHKAVREALVNTLIHADYEGRSGIRVLRDPAGFEFINPGLLLVTPDQLWKGGVSEPRNPLVQRLFGFLQLGEREGSGGPTILRAWSEQHWRLPELVEDVENSELHLKLRLVSLLPKESVDALRTELGAAFESQDELGRLALVTAHTEHGVTHGRIAGLTTAHSRDVTLKLQELVRKGLLVGSGPPRTRRYAIPGEQEQANRDQVGTKSGLSGDQVHVLEMADEPQSIAALLAASGRTNRTKFREQVLAPLLGAGLLEMTIPDKPRSSKQQYRTTAAGRTLLRDRS